MGGEGGEVGGCGGPVRPGNQEVRGQAVGGGRPAGGERVPHRPWPCWSASACPGAGGQVRPASAAHPPERDLRWRGRGDRRQHPCRLGGRRSREPDAAGRGDPGARVRGRAHPRRRHHRAGAGQGEDQDRPLVGLCPRRPAVCWPGPAGGSVLLLARPQRAASRAAPRRLRRDHAGRCLCRLQSALRAGSAAGADPRGCLLGTRPP